ncbi:hypothetical protein BV20DRAFT_958773 [Pilatotrama ljubarskyi]|nr:hypothetical protein BV20DRAFT_958773 [Pilatotrama ljubarskyi]
MRSGRSTVSPDGRTLAVSNLYDGFDLYTVHDGKHMRTVEAEIRVNVPLPVLFIADDALLMGTSCGEVRVCKPSDLDVIQVFHSRREFA